MKRENRFFIYVFVLLGVVMFVTAAHGKTQPESYRGFYVFGHEVRTFQPCGSDTVYWVRADQAVAKQLRDTHQKLASKPYDPVYAEVKGYLSEKAAEGFAADYDGQMMIQSVGLIRAKQGNDCDPVAAAEGGITGIVWKWRQSLYNNDQRAAPDDPSRYTIVFQPDGSLNIRVDCNRAGGKYSLQKSALTIEVTHSTRAACPPDSLEQTFLKNLNAAAIYFMRDGQLYIDLKYDSGTMKFAK
jgi:heat shock protein HslJ